MKNPEKIMALLLVPRFLCLILFTGCRSDPQPLNDARQIVVSIAVHEAPDAILELLKNVRHNLPGCSIVVHHNALSPVSPRELRATVRRAELNATSTAGSIVVNPKRIAMAKPADAMPRSLLDILLVNVAHATTELAASFTHVVHTCANERFVRPGAAAHVLAHDAGISLIPRFGCSSNDGLPARVSEDKGCLPHGKNAAALRRDPLMQAIAPSKTAIRWGQLDGAFFRRELISEFANISSALLKPGRVETPMEYYLPTFCFARALKSPTTALTYMDWHYTSSRHKLEIKPADVAAVRRGRRGASFFSVKRVQPDDHALRELIAKLD